MKPRSRVSLSPASAIRSLAKIALVCAIMCVSDASSGRPSASLIVLPGFSAQMSVGVPSGLNALNGCVSCSSAYSYQSPKLTWFGPKSCCRIVVTPLRQVCPV